MRFANPFEREFWIMDDFEYQHDPNVVPFPNRHARANAAQAAVTLEEDRRATRREEIEEHLHDLHAQRERINGLIFTLENEHELLGKAR